MANKRWVSKRVLKARAREAIETPIHIKQPKDREEPHMSVSSGGGSGRGHTYKKRHKKRYKKLHKAGVLAIVPPSDVAALTSIIRVNDEDEFVGRGKYPHSGITFVSLVPVQQMLKEFEAMRYLTPEQCRSKCVMPNFRRILVNNIADWDDADKISAARSAVLDPAAKVVWSTYNFPREQWRAIGGLRTLLRRGEIASTDLVLCVGYFAPESGMLDVQFGLTGTCEPQDDIGDGRTGLYCGIRETKEELNLRLGRVLYRTPRHNWGNVMIARIAMP